MKVSDLIGHFCTKTDLPVDVNELLPLLCSNGDETDIQFVGVDLDPEVLQGKIKIWNDRQGVYGADTKRFANIYYHRGHETDWQRFICCKELMHLLDPDAAHTNSTDAINQLAEKIGLPPYMQDPIADGLATNVDRLAEFRAAAIMLPMAARNLLQPKLHDGSITISDIAIMADIPRKYAAFVMSPTWDQVHELFLNA
jgi:hypothetical protein